MTFATADIFDSAPASSSVCDTELRDFGRRRAFWGQAVTLRVLNDHRAGIDICFEAGQGKILVIDGHASREVAVFGATMALIAMRNGWAGVIVFGAIRDVQEIATIDLGVKALYTTPRSASEPAPYERGVSVRSGNSTFRPGDWLYADSDGVLVRQAEYTPPLVHLRK